MKCSLPAILFSLLWASLLAAGCDDHILPADEGDIWGDQQVVFTDVSTTRNDILSMALNSDMPGSPLATGQILYPPQAGRILFATLDGQDNASLNVAGAGLSTTRTIAKEDYYFYLQDAAALTSDGNTVAFVSQSFPSYSWQLYIHELDGSVADQLVDGDIGEVSTLIFSPDNRFLAISAQRPSDTEEKVYIYDRLNKVFLSGPQRIILDTIIGVARYWYQWMPDNTLLYSGADPYTGDPGLYTMSPDNPGYAHKIADGEFFMASPSADGKIAFVRNNSLWVMEGDGSNQRVVLSPDPTIAEVMLGALWSPDNTKILVHRIILNPFTLVLDAVDIRTGRHKTLISNAYPGFWFD